MLRGDYESMEYLATYYAAVDDVQNALMALEAAYDLSPHRMLAWIKVSDDFHNIETDPGFIAMIKSWQNNKKNRTNLKVANRKVPQLNILGNTDPNAPLGMSKKAKRQYRANQRRKN
jgi:hypothetical protein